MAIIFCKPPPTDKERLRTLEYPFPPLLQNYYSEKLFMVAYITDLMKYCKTIEFDWDYVYEKFETDFDTMMQSDFYDTEENASPISIPLLYFHILYQNNCKNMDFVFQVLSMYYLNKVTKEDGPRLRRKQPKTDSSEDKDKEDEPDQYQIRVRIFNYCTLYAIHNGDVKYLRLLARYGIKLVYSLQILDAKNELKAANATAKTFVTWLSNEYGVNSGVVLKNLTHYIGNKKSIWRRKYEVIRGFEAVMRKRNQCLSLNRYVECVKLYFESVRQPFITEDEIKELVLQLLRGLHIPDEHDLANKFAKDFIELFPEYSSRDFCSPRRLQHLARCKIRKIIGIMKSLPLSVNTLFEECHISKEMKSYLLCDIPLMYK